MSFLECVVLSPSFYMLIRMFTSISVNREQFLRIFTGLHASHVDFLEQLLNILYSC